MTIAILYIDSTTVLSDIIRIIICAHVGVYISIPGCALADWLYSFTLFGNRFNVARSNKATISQVPQTTLAARVTYICLE